MREETVRKEIVVIGGGLAGVCAAISAARLGRQVALVHNRPVLGGNSSSEVRVWVSGACATGVNRYARETGIMGELFLENQFRNPDGNPYYWDMVVLEAVRAESNIELFLNTDVRQVDAEGGSDSRRIRAVHGWMMGSERSIRFEGELFLDCSGDGLVGFLAGARYRLGREARHEFGESLAPEKADEVTLGSTILFYTKDVGYPVKYVPPSFAKNIEQTSIPMRRIIRSGDSGCHYWWIEWGGELDTVHDNERIRDELWAAIYGIWDYIKNSGKFDADTLTLEWVGSLPGKREYRRFIGDYMLHQNDITGQTPFADRIGFGGWSIDLHPPEGMYSAKGGSKHLHPDGIYHIPFRSLYSVNVDNLLFAGRNISATHIAFGTTRVMATCAVMGEAAGTGAALCAELRLTPRELAQGHMERLQQTLLRQDAAVIGIRHIDPADWARGAAVAASSTLRRLRVERSCRLFPLHTDAALLLPIDPHIDGIELLVDAAAATVVEAELWDTGLAENYIPHTLVAAARAGVSAGERQWITLPIAWRPERPQNGFLIIKANPDAALHVSDEPLTGVLSFARSAHAEVDSGLEDRRLDQPVIQWSMKSLVRQPFCFRLAEETEAYAPHRATDGYSRPYGSPHMWASEPLRSGEEAWLELDWEQPVQVREIHVTFNDDVNEYLINLHFIKTPFEVIPELIRDYRIELWREDSGWTTVVAVKGNRKRKRVHHLPEDMLAGKIRLVAELTNGCARAEVAEIRVYGQEK
ncbi:FAD dependent oxidoreductase [Paenibacillus sp. UNCCL117]|uniref:FAD-dependent oxidoreductase n=1 Tax=unclassified Paenibacillus TaxID=185978 RepID=UPI00088D8016|nr:MULTISPECIES: FAD-dependent oxidoreductase [unclassified Paenibacillus]SDD90624.1 FAD dependent oxidoreductase [Paenibacillus sp. cl123]SFW43880.1 FAD dependent oxidoreductase [Paenibacillus sp. UNCCL117]